MTALDSGVASVHDDPTLLARLSDKFTPGKDCWEWTGAKDANGYGQIWANKRVQYAHRVMYELTYEPIEPGTAT